MYFDRDGLPIDIHRWAELASDYHYKRVDLTHVMDLSDGREVTVSTVWIGIDISVGGPPSIYESMSFNGDMAGDLCDRYATLDDARMGHTMMVIEVCGDMIDPVAMEPDA